MAEPIVVKPINEYTPEEWQRVETAVRQGQQMRENKRKLVENLPEVLPSETQEGIVTTANRGHALEGIIGNMTDQECTAIKRIMTDSCKGATVERIMTDSKGATVERIMTDSKGATVEQILAKTASSKCVEHRQEIKGEVGGNVNDTPLDHTEEMRGKDSDIPLKQIVCIENLKVEHQCRPGNSETERYSPAPGCLAVQERTLSEKLYMCEFCNKEFKSLITLEYHERRRHSGQNVHVCKTCKKQFLYSSNLAAHQRTICNVPYICKVCNKGFLTTVARDDHLKIHTGQRCQELTIMKVKGNGSDTRLEKCEIRGNGSSTPVCGTPLEQIVCIENLKVEYKCRPGNSETERYHCETAYMCKFCSKGFKTKMSLYFHEMRRICQRTHDCNICKEGFVNESQLAAHERTHLTPYKM